MIKVKNITKKYGKFTALKNVSFEIKDKEIVGFLGPNGAGKSTTMNIITGCIQATSGTVEINGINIEKNENKAKKLIGYMPENTPVYTELTTKEFLTFMAELKGIKKEQIKQQVEKTIKDVQIKNVENQLIKTVSKGYRQRISLAGALIGNPEILILDEPTVGLDPRQIVQIRNLIKELSKTHTIMLSSHILSEVSQLCDKIIIINNGEIITEDTTKKLEQNVKNKSGILVIAEGLEEQQEKIKKEMPQIEEITKIKKNEDGTITYLIRAKENSDIRKELFKEISKNNVIIYEIKTTEGTLEDAFINIIDKQKGGKK